MEHKRSIHCVGEVCRCGKDATHKISEVVQGDDEWPPVNQRHPFTRYVCCHCFSAIFGAFAKKWCGLSTHALDSASPLGTAVALLEELLANYNYDPVAVNEWINQEIDTIRQVINKGHLQITPSK